MIERVQNNTEYTVVRLLNKYLRQQIIIPVYTSDQSVVHIANDCHSMMDIDPIIVSTSLEALIGELK